MHPVAIQVASKPGRVSNQNPNSLWTSFSNRLRRTRASVIEALRVYAFLFYLQGLVTDLIQQEEDVSSIAIQEFLGSNEISCPFRLR